MAAFAAFATIEEYEARAGTLTEPRRGQAIAYLTDASALMRGKIPAGFSPDPDTLRAICIAVVRRVMANPGGYRQRTIGRYSETLGEDGGLYLTAGEIEQLQPTEADPDSDAAYTVGLADQGLPGWVADPAGSGGWRR
ncbi:hypothetical protein [Streptomyces sp. CAU 1734]|uniref:hypothetical protein n=1 Tax=Streptomyces sp. CAU 1734 TaxID=3140360 RepID=UPI00326133C5